MPESRVRCPTAQEPGDLQEYGQPAPVPKDVFERVKNLKEQTVFVTERREWDALPEPAMAAIQEIVGKADMNSLFVSLPQFSMQFYGSLETGRVQSFGSLREANLRINLAVNKWSFRTYFDSRMKARPHKRSAGPVEGLGSDENVVIILRTKRHLRAVVRQQRNSFQDRILHTGLFKGIDERPELLKDCFASDPVRCGPSFQRLCYIVWEEMKSMRALHPLQKIDGEPAQIEPRQSRFPFPRAAGSPGSRPRFAL